MQYNEDDNKSEFVGEHMEELFVYSLLCDVGYEKYVEYRKALDVLFLEDPENEVLLDLEGREYKDAMLHLYHIMETEKYDVSAFGKHLMKNLKHIYEESDLTKFAKKMYELWKRLPGSIDQKEPFQILCYADDCLDYGDEKQCRELYEKALSYYDVT